MRYTAIKNRTFVPVCIIAAIIASLAGSAAPVYAAAGSSGDKSHQVRLSGDGKASTAAAGDLPAASGKVTIVSVPGWSFLDWSEDVLSGLPELSRLIRQGAIGAMNVRTPEKGLEDAYATLGAGAPAISGSGYLAHNARGEGGDRSGAELYRRLTGREPDETGVVVPEIAAIRRRNENGPHRARPGLLGELLRRHGIATAVYGNGDTPQERKRYAPLAVMDESGRVPLGGVDGGMLVTDPAAPTGTRADPSALLHAWESIGGPSVVLLEWGDLLRFQTEAPLYGNDLARTQKLAALRRLDAFVGGIANRLRPGETLWLVSPFVGVEATRSKLLLAPVVYNGPGVSGGLLTSPSTRREGVVTATDFAPTVLAAFGIPAPYVATGQAMEVTERTDALEALRTELETILEVYRLRPRALIPFVSVEAAVMLTALLVVWGKMFKAARPVEALLLALLAAPLVLLAVGWLHMTKPLPWKGQAALFVAGTASIACICIFRTRALRAAVWLSAITAAALLLDGVTGAEGMKRSVLGYDPMIGARYYGMGNEYMGVLVGAVTLVFAAALERRRGRLAPATAAPAAPAPAAPAP
ncbi:hypothetical protein PV407_10155, partial [Paenibacillus sp. GYB003]